MDMKAFEITTKMLVGEDVTEEEKSYTRSYDARYAIVRHLVMEKFRADKSKSGLTNFHFTPGEKFMETPIIDIVNSLTEIVEVVKVTYKSKPPHTGTAKRNI